MANSNSNSNSNSNPPVPPIRIPARAEGQMTERKASINVFINSHTNKINIKEDLTHDKIMNLLNINYPANNEKILLSVYKTTLITDREINNILNEKVLDADGQPDLETFIFIRNLFSNNFELIKHFLYPFAGIDGNVNIKPREEHRPEINYRKGLIKKLFRDHLNYIKTNNTYKNIYRELKKLSFPENPELTNNVGVRNKLHNYLERINMIIDIGLKSEIYIFILTLYVYIFVYWLIQIIKAKINIPVEVNVNKNLLQNVSINTNPNFEQDKFNQLSEYIKDIQDALNDFKTTVSTTDLSQIERNRPANVGQVGGDLKYIITNAEIIEYNNLLKKLLKQTYMFVENTIIQNRSYCENLHFFVDNLAKISIGKIRRREGEPLKLLDFNGFKNAISDASINAYNQTKLDSFTKMINAENPSLNPPYPNVKTKIHLQDELQSHPPAPPPAGGGRKKTIKSNKNTTKSKTTKAKTAKSTKSKTTTKTSKTKSTKSSKK